MFRCSIPIANKAQNRVPQSIAVIIVFSPSEAKNCARSYSQPVLGTFTMPILIERAAIRNRARLSLIGCV
jgi:hypothetical protein